MKESTILDDFQDKHSRNEEDYNILHKYSISLINLNQVNPISFQNTYNILHREVVNLILFAKSCYFNENQLISESIINNEFKEFQFMIYNLNEITKINQKLKELEMSKRKLIKDRITSLNIEIAKLKEKLIKEETTTKSLKEKLNVITYTFSEQNLNEIYHNLSTHCLDLEIVLAKTLASLIIGEKEVNPDIIEVLLRNRTNFIKMLNKFPLIKFTDPLLSFISENVDFLSKSISDNRLDGNHTIFLFFQWVKTALSYLQLQKLIEENEKFNLKIEKEIDEKAKEILLLNEYKFSNIPYFATNSFLETIQSLNYFNNQRKALQFDISNTYFTPLNNKIIENNQKIEGLSPLDKNSYIKNEPKKYISTESLMKIKSGYCMILHCFKDSFNK